MVNISQLRFAYSKGRNIFEGIDLSIPSGTVLGLLGRNGEGKSTLMKLITGQLLPTSGQIETLGHQTLKRPLEILQRVYMLAEEPVVPRMSVRAYINSIAPFYPSYDEQLADKLIQEFEIDWEMNTAKMSLGQRKKAAIALALAVRTPLLLMDEPTNGLDIPSKSLFRRLLAEYISPEQTVIISTHQVRDLEQVIDHILLLNRGKVVCNESIATLSERYYFGQVTTGSPAPIYSESSVIGEVGIWERQTRGEELTEAGDFSMELFFNAMISKKLRK